MMSVLLRRYFQHQKQFETIVINFNPRDIDRTRGASIKAGTRVPAARRNRYELVALKTRKFPFAISCWNRHAPRPMSNVPRKNNLLDTIYSGSHAPVPTSIEQVSFVLRQRAEKG